MFAHKLSMYLKNDGALAFKHRIEADIIPLLRKQKGFLEEITFLYLNGREVHAFSLWESPSMRRRSTGERTRKWQECWRP